MTIFSGNELQASISSSKDDGNDSNCTGTAEISQPSVLAQPHSNDIDASESKKDVSEVSGHAFAEILTYAIDLTWHDVWAQKHSTRKNIPWLIVEGGCLPLLI